MTWFDRVTTELSASLRHDTQVKMSGQRVELSEVECHLQGCLSLSNQKWNPQSFSMGSIGPEYPVVDVIVDIRQSDEQHDM